ncbi:MAG: 2Fe-2S iron-sulfur cluster-binding protein [bacterium]
MTCRITYERLHRTKDIEPGCSLLAAFKHHNIDVAYSCEAATCGTCVVRIDAGQELLTPMDSEESTTLVAAGYEGAADPRYRLACQAYLKGHGELKVFNKVLGS